MNDIPSTIEEAFGFLRNLEGIENFLNADEEEAVAREHHGLGQWIRNHWGLWKQEGMLYKGLSQRGLFHADDMSGTILRAFHRYENGKPMQITEIIKEYQEYWNAQGHQYGTDSTDTD